VFDLDNSRQKSIRDVFFTRRSITPELSHQFICCTLGKMCNTFGLLSGRNEPCMSYGCVAIQIQKRVKTFETALVHY
jgi:hypothetical protein